MAQNENKIYRKQMKKNNIKEMLTYEYNLETNDSLLIYRGVYDKEGKLIKDLRYNDKNEIRYKYLIHYNGSLMSKQVGYDEMDSISTVIVYKYDENGNRIEYMQQSPNGAILVHQKRNYNKRNQNTTLYTKLSAHKKFHLSQKYYYRKDGQYKKTESYRFGDSYNIDYARLYKYNGKGNEIAQYKIIGKEKSKTYFNKYNRKNQLITCVNEKTKTYENLKYDLEGNVIEKTNFEKSELVRKRRYVFIKHGS
jgi:hypothetical protein